MGGAYKFTNDELRLILHELSPLTAKGQALCNKINDELARREVVSKRQAGKGVVRKKDVPYEQLIAAAMMINEGATIRATVAATGVPYGRVWKMKRATQVKKQEETNEPGQPNQNRPK